MPHFDVDAIADPLAFLQERLRAAKDRAWIELVGDTQRFHVHIVDRQSGAQTRWEWAWTRGISPAADRAAEDDVYRQTISILAEDGLIQMPAVAASVR